MPIVPGGLEQAAQLLLLVLAATSTVVAWSATRGARRLRAELDHERRRSDLLMRATQSGIIDWDVVEDRIDYSERFKEILGFPQAADLSDRRQFIDWVHPFDRERVEQTVVGQLRAPRGGGAGAALHAPIEYRLRRVDGGYSWVRGSSLSVCDADGRARRYVASILDISEPKRQEGELANQLKFIHDLFDAVPLSLAFRDVDGRFKLVNRTWEQYFGYRREQMIGSTLQELAPAERVDPVIAEDRAALARGPDAPPQPRDVVYNGRHYLQTRTALADAQGRLIGVLVTGQDQTERLAIESELATQHQRFELVLRAARVGVVDIDASTGARVFSARFKEMLGYAPDADTSSWNDLSFVHPEDLERVRLAYIAHLKGEDPAVRDVLELEFRMLRADGSAI